MPSDDERNAICLRVRLLYHRLLAVLVLGCGSRCGLEVTRGNGMLHGGISGSTGALRWKTTLIQHEAAQCHTSPVQGLDSNFPSLLEVPRASSRTASLPFTITLTRPAAESRRLLMTYAVIVTSRT